MTLGDIATVVVTDNAGELYTKVNGDNGILITFTKQSNYATAEVSNNISARFEELEGQYEGLSFAPLMDQGDYIYLIVETITSSLLWGALFSVVILYLFLRDWRPTVITLVSIPVSVIFAIVLMYFTGVTINMISLSGLAVAVGMLVDNSVVVIENIYRLRAKGATIIQAAVSGAGQVLGAVTASTLTTVCVFAPIVFVEGLTRQLFTDLALTITYSLLASLLVALTLVPAMASGMLRRPMVQKPGLLDKVYPAYRKAIAFSLDHKAGVLLLSLVLLVTSAGACLRRGFTFMPEMDMNNLSLTITMPEDTSREEAVRLADEVLERVMTVDDVQDAGFMMGGGTMGGLNMGGAMGGASGGSYDVEGYITMPEGTFGSVAGKEIETLCADLPCEVTASGVMSGMMSYMTGSGVSLQVFGSDMADLQSSARTIARRLEQVEGVSEVSDGLDASAPALQVTIDRKAAAEKGLTVAQVYMQIAAALQSSASVSDVTLDSEDMDLTVDAAEGSVLKRENLLELELSAVRYRDRRHRRWLQRHPRDLRGAAGRQRSDAAGGRHRGIQRRERADHGGHEPAAADAAAGRGAGVLHHGGTVPVAEIPVHRHVYHPAGLYRRLPGPADRGDRGICHQPDRLCDAGGHYRQQRYRAGGLHQPAAAVRHGAPGGDHRRGRDPPAADPDDQSDHDFGPDRHRHGEKRRHGADAAHRRGLYRWTAVRHADDAVRGALYVRHDEQEGHA